MFWFGEKKINPVFKFQGFFPKENILQAVFFTLLGFCQEGDFFFSIPRQFQTQLGEIFFICLRSSGLRTWKAEFHVSAGMSRVQCRDAPKIREHSLHVLVLFSLHPTQQQETSLSEADKRWVFVTAWVLQGFKIYFNSQEWRNKHLCVGTDCSSFWKHPGIEIPSPNSWLQV